LETTSINKCLKVLENEERNNVAVTVSGRGIRI
jgi:hypothetical protein